jgi:hypothetical protein
MEIIMKKLLISGILSLLVVASCTEKREDVISPLEGKWNVDSVRYTETSPNGNRNTLVGPANTWIEFKPEGFFYSRNDANELFFVNTGSFDAAADAINGVWRPVDQDRRLAFNPGIAELVGSDFMGNERHILPYELLETTLALDASTPELVYSYRYAKGKLQAQILMKNITNTIPAGIADGIEVGYQRGLSEALVGKDSLQLAYELGYAKGMLETFSYDTLTLNQYHAGFKAGVNANKPTGIADGQSLSDSGTQYVLKFYFSKD